MKAKPKRPREVWQRRLPKPLKLKRDLGELVTLKDAARLMTDRLPEARQVRPHWQHAARLALEAARARGARQRPTLEAFAYQLMVALQYERMI